MALSQFLKVKISKSNVEILFLGKSTGSLCYNILSDARQAIPLLSNGRAACLTCIIQQSLLLDAKVGHLDEIPRFALRS